MRQKFQQRKSAVDNNNPEPNSANNVVDSKPKSSIGSMQKHQSAAAGSGSKNLNTSFSAMNTSLQQKWSALKNTKTASARGDNMSSTMIGGGQAGR